VQAWIAAGAPLERAIIVPRQLRVSRHSIARQLARTVGSLVSLIGLDQHDHGTHSLRCTRATLIFRRTKHLRAVQLRFGHPVLERTTPCREDFLIPVPPSPAATNGRARSIAVSLSARELPKLLTFKGRLGSYWAVMSTRLGSPDGSYLRAITPRSFGNNLCSRVRRTGIGAGGHRQYGALRAPGRTDGRMADDAPLVPKIFTPLTGAITSCTDSPGRPRCGEQANEAKGSASAKMR
jgi:hypothetical protein